MMRSLDLLILGAVLLPLSTFWACSPATAPSPGEAPAAVRDPHSAARPDQVAVSHLDLELTVDFATRTLGGRATLHLDRRGDASQVVLDTRDLTIQGVTLDDGTAAPFTLGPTDPHLGQALTVDLGPQTAKIHIDYTTAPTAAALLWLDPPQTASGQPFLFTQSQAILARTWIPLQDTPAVRMTYEARVQVPAGLLAVMSAENPIAKSADGRYQFRMPQAIPSYLMALAVGDLEFRPLGERAGVYAEPPVVEQAAWELAETPAMIAAAERLYGPYRWGRYDVLVLPPSFPFGGMENPRLTFATPTILAGDRSLVSLIAHELAHSWSGNLVTNATWDDFWLNEGFTVYFERRIMEELSGRPYAEMLAALGRQDLEGIVGQQGAQSPDTHLKLDLAGRNPDDGMTDVAYEKGYLFLRWLEETVGRERFDRFLRHYFDRFAFQSMTTEGFLLEARETLLEPIELEGLDLDRWVYGPGIPPGAPQPTPEAFEQVESQVAAWDAGTPAGELVTTGWSTHQWLHFLRHLPADLGAPRMAELDGAFGFSQSGNSEILCAWLLQAIAHRYEPAYPALEGFLTRQGRRKFLRPLYARLAETPEGRARAVAIYAKARPTYHAVSTATLDELLGWEGES